MNDMAEIKANADRLVELTNQQSVIKAEIDEIKAWFEKIATDDLKDTKKKTIDYWGSNNSKVVVGNSETVKPVSMTMVKKLLGDVFEEFVKEDTSYKMTDPCKRLFAMIFLGNYTEGTGSEIWIDRNVDSQYSFRQSKRDKSQTDRWSDESYGLLRMNIFS